MRKLLAAATMLTALAFAYSVLAIRSEEQKCDREGYSECTAAALNALGAAVLGPVLSLLLAIYLFVRFRGRRSK